MPGRVVVVHDEREFLNAVVAALRLAGWDVAAFTDSMPAIDALDAAHLTEVLIARVKFAPGKPHGIALARMARAKRPKTQVIFTGPLELAEHADGLVNFMPMPVEVADVVVAVGRLLEYEG